MGAKLPPNNATGEHTHNEPNNSTKWGQHTTEPGTKTVNGAKKQKVPTNTNNNQENETKIETTC